MSQAFRAFVVNKTEKEFTARVQELTRADLPPGEVLIRVAYSGVNYKDALACIPDGKIVRSYPFVPGVDLSGAVVESQHALFRVGPKPVSTHTSPHPSHT